MAWTPRDPLRTPEATPVSQGNEPVTGEGKKPPHTLHDRSELLRRRRRFLSTSSTLSKTHPTQSTRPVLGTEVRYTREGSRHPHPSTPWGFTGDTGRETGLPTLVSFEPSPNTSTVSYCLSLPPSVGWEDPGGDGSDTPGVVLGGTTVVDPEASVTITHETVSEPGARRLDSLSPPTYPIRTRASKSKPYWVDIVSTD